MSTQDAKVWITPLRAYTLKFQHRGMELEAVITGVYAENVQNAQATAMHLLAQPEDWECVSIERKDL